MAGKEARIVEVPQGVEALEAVVPGGGAWGRGMHQRTEVEDEVDQFQKPLAVVRGCGSEAHG